MASLYGSEFTDAFQTVPSVKVDVSKWGGRLRVAYGTYELTGDLSAADKIYLARLPKGAYVYGAILAFDALGGGTMDVGYEYPNADGTDDPDGFVDGADVTSAGIVGSVEAALVDSIGLSMDGEADVVATVATDTSATSGTVKVVILYALD